MITNKKNIKNDLLRNYVRLGKSCFIPGFLYLISNLLVYSKYTFLFFIFLFIFQNTTADDSNNIDSIMNEIMRASLEYGSIAESYEAEVYMKTTVETQKKNFLYKYTNLIPDFVIHDPNNDSAIIESFSKIKFTAPFTYSQDIKYVNGTLTKKQDIARLPFRFISMDVYKESAHGETFFLPLHFSTSKYYDYEIIYIDKSQNKHKYIIAYLPKYINPQLISGNFTVEEGSWRVLNFYGKGNDLFFDFSFLILMGEDEKNRYFPVKFDIKETYNYLGNRVLNRYQANLDYVNIVYKVSSEREKNYNLGNKFQMRLDSVPLKMDVSLWDSIRRVPLTSKEKSILDDYYEKEKNKIIQEQSDSSNSKSPKKSSNKLVKNVVVNTKYRYKSGDFQYSGLLNPLMFGYSTRDGITYQQKARFHFNLPRQQRININLSGSYLFGRKQFNYGVKTVWNYEPFKLGYLKLDIGRGNPVYSSRFLHQLNDSLYTLNKASKYYFKDYYAKLYNSIELANGLQLGTGIDYHIRQPYMDALPIPGIVRDLENADDQNIFKTQYDFVPLVSLSWTPEQYYVLERNQKTYVRSNYPTFKIELAKSLTGVLNNESSYARAEFDVNQQIRFGSLSSLNLHTGLGMFFNQSDEYFNDFSYFARTHFPETWGDGIGGSFNVLRTHQFNASEKYIQAHLMYDSSKLLFNRLPIMSMLMNTERIYLSQLYTPLLMSYTEFGYGIGNRYLNAAVFVGFHKLKFQNIEAKAIFLL